MALPFFHPYRGSVGRFFQGDPTLQGYWQFYSSSVDNSGNGHNGADASIYGYGPQYSPFSGGGGVFFGGNSSVINLDSSAFSYNRTQPWTFMLFIKNYNTDASDRTIFQKYDSANYAGYAIELTGSTPQIYVALKDSSAEYISAYGGSIEYGDSRNPWHHIAVTYDGSSNVNGIHIYKDGLLVQVSTSGTTLTGSLINTKTPSFGGSGTSTNYSIEAYLTEAAIWNRALSAQEISQYYQWATSAQKKSWHSLLPYLSLALSEAVTNTDTFLKGLYRSFTESITNTDTFAGMKVLFALFTEAVQSTDTLIKTIGKKLSEAVQNTDTFIKGIYRNFTEAVTNSDTFNILKALFVTFSESVKSTASLWLNGMFIDAWWTKRVRAVINWTKRTIGSVVYTKRNKPQ